MKERPILFNGEMVRAILEGHKTQTRRVIKRQPRHNIRHDNKKWIWDRDLNLWIGSDGTCPYGQPGDRLWCRESIRVIEWRGFRQCRIRYEADGVESDWMDYPARLKGGERELKGRLYPNGAFREAARTWLEIAGVRVEKLQEISEEDTKAEGIEPCSDCDLYMDHHGIAGEMFHAEDFKSLWDSIARPGSDWESNPWVWVIEFKKI